MDGRVKTLHPKLHAGLLAVRSDPEHVAAMAEHGAEPIDLVCVNLYPFERTAARRGVSDAEVIENIDVGGPTMIRASAKNHAFVAVVVKPEAYDAVLEELRAGEAAAVDGHARGARGRRVRLHRALRHGDRALVRRALRGLPAAVRPGLREGHRPLLRREPAPARRVLPAGRLAHAPALDGAPAPGPAALVQQPLRPRRGAPGRARVRGPRLRDHQARQPVRRGGGADGDRGLRARLRMRSGQRLRRHHRREPPAGPRGGRGDRGAVRRGADRARLRRRRRSRS